MNMQKNVKKVMITNLILASISLLAFVAMTTLVLCDYNFKIDQFNSVIANNRTKFWTEFFKVFTHLGSFYTLALISLVGVLILFFYKKDRRLSVFYAVGFSKICIANFILKLIIKRLRPEHFMIIKEVGFSFPSGHTMMSFAFFFLLGHYVWRTIKNKQLKIILIALFTVLTLGIGFSRIYLGVHYLTDVLGGLLITFAILLFNLMVYNSKMFKSLKDNGVENEEKF